MLLLPVKNIVDLHLEIPDHAPVMVLPQAVLFPSALFPLFIFEQRYREMLAWSLENERMFCIALLREGRSDWTSPEDFYPTAGLGLVRACVEREDGTSHLVLQGLTRVAFTGFTQESPFVIARLRPLGDVQPVDDAEAGLSAQVLELCSRLRKHGVGVPDALDDQLAQVDDDGLLADLVAHAFISVPVHRQSLLETVNVHHRLRLLIEYLQAELPT